MTVKEALQAVVDNADNPTLNYAVGYAVRGIRVLDEDKPLIDVKAMDDLKSQCLYVLGNMTGWAGELASEVRETLVGFAAIDVERR